MPQFHIDGDNYWVKECGLAIDGQRWSEVTTPGGDLVGYAARPDGPVFPYLAGHDEIVALVREVNATIHAAGTTR